MREAADFVAGLRLARMLYEEAGRAIIEAVVEPGAYAAGLSGRGSEVLAFDTERSTDHDWGPRFQVFLAEDGFASVCARLDEELERRLPARIHGHDVRFSSGDPDDAVVAVDGPGRPEPRHHVEITTVGRWLARHLGVAGLSDLSPLDWLTFPEQRLLELTSGEIFHDPRGELAAVRGALGAYPRDVWLYRMACQWQRLSQHEGFAGRCAEAGDGVGMRIVAARLARDCMRLCFLMERRYAPYDKWLGTAFGRLACAGTMQPLLSAVTAAAAYPDLEQNLARLYRLLGEMHNSLGVTGPMDPEPRTLFSRPYRVMRSDRFANALLRVVHSEQLRRIPVRMGGVDQLVDNTDFLETPSVYRRLLGLYAPASR